MRERENRRITPHDIAQKALAEARNFETARLSQKEQDRIRAIAAATFPDYREQYKDDEAGLAEAVKQNWIAKANAFTEVANIFGLKSRIKSDKNDYTFAALTLNASFVLIGPGSMNPRSEGARVSYKPIDPKDVHKRITKSIERGGYMAAIPEVGTSLFMNLRRDNPDHPLGPYDYFPTSQVIRLCAGNVKNVPAFFAGFEATLPDVYKAIDQLSFKMT